MQKTINSITPNRLKGHGDTADSERLDLRLSRELKSLLEAAASTASLSMSAFVKAAAKQAAEEVIERERVIKLTRESSFTIMELLENPPEHNERLIAAMNRAKSGELNIVGTREQRKRKRAESARDGEHSHLCEV